MALHDISKGGRVFMGRDSFRMGIHGALPGSDLDRDVSALDASSPADLSPDGDTLLIAELVKGASAKAAVYLRHTRTMSPPILLGEGLPLSLSPDGQWVLVQIPSERRHLILLPTGAGEVRHLPEAGLEYGDWGRFLPDGRRIVCLATSREKPSGYVFRTWRGGDRALSHRKA